MRPLLRSYWLVLSFLFVFPCPPSAQVTMLARPTPNLDLPALWIASDAVVFLKIRQTAGRPDSRNGENSYVEHQASVLEVFRKHIGKPGTGAMHFLQSMPASGYQERSERAEDPSRRAGEDVVAFLTWDASEEAFLAFLTLEVCDGKVQSNEIRELASAVKIEAFLAMLRAMME